MPPQLSVPTILLFCALFVQGCAMMADEFLFHRKRQLPRWERLGHPFDTLTVLVVFASFSVLPKTDHTPLPLFLWMVFSCAFVTKDEWVHHQYCSANEQWLHSVLFLIHPVVFFLSWLAWKQDGPQPIFLIQTCLLAGFFLYQTIYWNWIQREN